jgi:hypothetical protein
MIFHSNVTAYAYVGRNGYRISNFTVVANVRIGHYHIVVAYSRYLAFTSGAVYRDVFAQNVVITYDDVTCFALKLVILRRTTYKGTIKDLTVSSDLRVFQYLRV